jgi:hypothetical protein
MLKQQDVRSLALIAALLAAGYLVLVATMELIKQASEAEVATLRADLAAWQVGQLMEEARNITKQAAEERGLP